MSKVKPLPARIFQSLPKAVQAHITLLEETVESQAKTIQEQSLIIQDLTNKFQEQTKVIEKLNRKIEEQSRIIEAQNQKIEEQARTINECRQEIAELKEKLNQNSRNSSIPPSRNPLNAKPAPPKKPSGKKQGGQPGHQGHLRERLPPTTVIELSPQTCTKCLKPLTGSDPKPKIHQVVEIPPIQPIVTEYRQHKICCQQCGTLNQTAIPQEAQCGFGPQLQATLSFFSGYFRLSKRKIQDLCEHVFHIPISLGSISKLEAKTSEALEPIYDEAKKAAQKAEVAYIDETSWKEKKEKKWLWIMVTKFLTIYHIAKSRSRECLNEIMGAMQGIVVSDRFASYEGIPDKRRQLCWSHLIRDFQAMIDRKNAGSEIGEELLAIGIKMLKSWKKVRDGTMTLRGFLRSYESWIPDAVHEILIRGSA